MVYPSLCTSENNANHAIEANKSFVSWNNDQCIQDTIRSGGSIWQLEKQQKVSSCEAGPTVQLDREGVVRSNSTGMPAREKPQNTPGSDA